MTWLYNSTICYKKYLETRIIVKIRGRYTVGAISLSLLLSYQGSFNHGKFVVK